MKYNSQIINYITLFEDLTKAKIKDCLSNDRGIIFVVYSGEISKAIGKNGINVKRMGNLIKKNIKIVEFNEDIIKFVRNYIYPIDVKEINFNDSKLIIMVKDKKSKALLMGRDSKNLLELKDILRRYFTINEIKII